VGTGGAGGAGSFDLCSQNNDALLRPNCLTLHCQSGVFISQLTDLGCYHFSGEDRKTPSESNSPSSSSLSALSDSANSKDDSDGSQKTKGGNNLLVISVVPGSQPPLNSEEKPEKGKRGARHPCSALPTLK
jgi:hypothetical protein